MRTGLAVLLVAQLGTSAGVARTSDDGVEPSMAPGPPGPTRPREDRQWYGWQILLTSGLGGVGFIGTLGFGWSSQLTGPALALYLAGGPAVHFANGQPGRMPASLGFELAAPLVGSAAWLGGLILESPCDSGLPHASERDRMAGRCTLGPALLLGSLIAGPLIDAFALGWKPRTFEPSREGRPQAPAIAPFVGPTTAGGLAGLRGTF